ncbi:hypothetical protein [Nocardia sp. NPDC052566]|uniref:effector-associated constant component EACC1 n=1 Tax=Nocardia sp. NPDC052566 TaxID=3364330 RepID=UPI0037C57094
MELLIAVDAADDDVAELHSLYQAIVEDDDLRPAGKRLEPGAPSEGELGAEEIIRMVIDSAPLWTALSASFTAWLHMRTPRLRVKLTGPDGRTAEITASGGKAVDPAHVTAAIELVRGALDEAP